MDAFHQWHDMTPKKKKLFVVIVIDKSYTVVQCYLVMCFIYLIHIFWYIQKKIYLNSQHNFN